MGDNVRQIPGLHLSDTTVVMPDLYVRQRSQRSRNEIGKQPIKQETNFGDKAVAETEQKTSRPEIQHIQNNCLFYEGNLVQTGES